jgi:Leucine-rich repeat (LRR) protein
LAIVGHFRNLRCLVLSRCDGSITVKKQGDILLDSISKLEKLEKLIVPGGCITDDAVRRFIPRLKRLKYLGLSNTAITDKCIKSLLLLPNLEKISIKNTLISSIGLDVLSKHPRLSQIIVSYSTLRLTDIKYYKYQAEKEMKSLPMISTIDLPLNDEL